MSIAFKCDRCKDRFDGAALGVVTVDVNDSISQNYYEKIVNVTKELCESCLKTVFKGLTTTPTKEGFKELTTIPGKEGFKG